MKPFFLICFILLSGQISLVAQELERQVIGSSFGIFESEEGVQIEWIAGQTNTSTLDENSITLTQGFLQPLFFGLSNKIQNKLPQLSIQIFPNPFKNWLALKGQSLLSITRAQVISATGQVVVDKEGIIPELWETSSWPSGLYFIQFFQMNQAYQPILLLKNE
jgi:hypothetical protein